MMLDRGTQMKIGAPACVVGLVIGMFVPIYACLYRKRIFKRKMVSEKIRRRADTDSSYTSQWLKRHGILESGVGLKRQPSYMSTDSFTREQYASIETFGFCPDYSIESGSVAADYSTTDGVSVQPDYSVDGLENKSENPDYSFEVSERERIQSENPDYSFEVSQRERIQSENLDIGLNVLYSRDDTVKYNTHRGHCDMEDRRSAYGCGQLSTFTIPLPDYN